MLNPDDLSTFNRLRILDVDVDLASGTVWRDGEIIDLPDLSFRLLASLAKKAPEMVSKDALMAEVWGDVVVSDETLMQRVRLLRQALGDDGQNPRYIASVRGRGYRLNAPVERGARPAGQPTRTPARSWRLAAAVALAACVLLVIFIGLRSGPSDVRAISTLAVLPFADLSENRDYGYFADGMQEELLSWLARLDEVAVLSRTSTERYRDTTESLPDISRALDADGIVEGSVRVDGEQIRITVQLIAGATDQHIWSESYEGELSVDSVFEIQNDIADRIAEQLRVEYQRQRSANLGLPTANIEAYNLYLLGRHHIFRLTPENLEQAARFLEQAIELDANFAEAHVALGYAYAFLGSAYGQRVPREVLPRAREAALQALALDDRLASAHSLYADILTWYDWEFALAESEHRRAMALDPLTIVGYSLFLSTQGRHVEAIEIMERQVDAVPGDEWVQLNAGWRYLNADRPESAAMAAERAGTHPDAANLMGLAKLALGEPDEAIAIFEADIRRQGRGRVQLANLAFAHFKAGNSSQGQALLEELEGDATKADLMPVSLAAIYFAAGDEARAYKLLDDAVEARVRSVIFLNVSPLFAAQRDAPRFAALLERVGLPVDRK